MWSSSDKVFVRGWNIMLSNRYLRLLFLTLLDVLLLFLYLYFKLDVKYLRWVILIDWLFKLLLGYILVDTIFYNYRCNRFKLYIVCIVCLCFSLSGNIIISKKLFYEQRNKEEISKQMFRQNYE